MSQLANPELIKVVILLASSVTIVPLFKRLGLGSVLGYLVAGCFNRPICLWHRARSNSSGTFSGIRCGNVSFYYRA